MMNANNLINKVVLFANPEEQEALAGIVIDTLSKDLLYMKSISWDVEDTTSFYLLSLEYLACNPEVVQIFNTKDDFDKLVNAQKRKSEENKVVSLVRKKEKKDES